jgi:hypothetical protein
MKKEIYKIEILGAVFVVVLGSLWHFLYEWSGGNIVAGIFCPVNESVWEHMKLGFWPVLIYTLIEHRFVKKKYIDLLIIKSYGTIAMNIFIAVFFYTYTFVVGRHFLVVDIISFIAGVILCYIISTAMLIKDNYGYRMRLVGIFIIIIHAVSLILFTFSPPKLPMFKDSNSNKYGIQ